MFIIVSTYFSSLLYWKEFMSLFHQFALAFMAFFAIMNPVASLPVYISLTDGDDRETALVVAKRSLLLAFAIVAVFALCGRYLFELFGMTLPALRLAGGVLVFLIGFHMLQGQQSSVHHLSVTEKQALDKQEQLNVAISPLATPLLAGPGTIATAMNLSAHSGFAGIVITILAFALLCAMTYVLFVYGKTLVRWLGQNIMSVMTRMMGLILAVIGAQMLIEGVLGAFPALK